MRYASLALLALIPTQSLTVKFAPSGDTRALEAWIVDEVKKADGEILVAVYQFTSPRLADALAAAKRRGRTVRVLTDAEARKTTRATESWEILKKAGVDVRRVSPRDLTPGDEEKPRFHHKFCVIDGKRVLTGSMNWTVQGDRENHENVVLIVDGDVAGAYKKTFDSVWDDRSLSQE
jgi:phosphatidylserine/phosphatidylglycerophosphate/cardiolipin synthase-like enzyme